MSKEYISYKHHLSIVIVRADLKGKHRDYCLCWDCELFRPDNRKVNCDIANQLFNICVVNGVTTPVFECARFIEKKKVIK